MSTINITSIAETNINPTTVASHAVRTCYAAILKYLTPPCLSMGKCVEGPRYCGRDIVLNKKLDQYFRNREI